MDKKFMLDFFEDLGLTLCKSLYKMSEVAIKIIILVAAMRYMEFPPILVMLFMIGIFLYPFADFIKYSRI